MKKRYRETNMQIHAVPEFRTTLTFVYYTFRPLIRPSNAEFGLLYAASEQTFRAIAQWHSKTESRTVRGAFKF